MRNAKKSLQSTIYDLSMEKVNLLAIHDYPADYLDPIYDCPECKDTGYIGDKKCHCFQQKIREILYRQSNIENSAGNECFSAFRTDYYSSQRSGRERLSPRENIENVLSVSRSFIECFDSRSRTESFYLWECRCRKDISFELYCRRAAEFVEKELFI